jgi:hypothetical protein
MVSWSIFFDAWLPRQYHRDAHGPDLVRPGLALMREAWPFRTPSATAAGGPTEQGDEWLTRRNVRSGPATTGPCQPARSCRQGALQPRLSSS